MFLTLPFQCNLLSTKIIYLILLETVCWAKNVGILLLRTFVLLGSRFYYNIFFIWQGRWDLILVQKWQLRALHHSS
jgi:hypothetical protein